MLFFFGYVCVFQSMREKIENLPAFMKRLTSSKSFNVIAHIRGVWPKSLIPSIWHRSVEKSALFQSNIRFIRLQKHILQILISRITKKLINYNFIFFKAHLFSILKKPINFIY